MHTEFKWGNLLIKVQLEVQEEDGRGVLALFLRNNSCKDGCKTDVNRIRTVSSGKLLSQMC
jgi:hypothetical protein